MPSIYAHRILDSVATTHFRDALIQHAVEEENISFPADWVTAGIQKCLIHDVAVISDENLDWEIQFFSKDTQSDNDLDVNSFITAILFANGDGSQVATAGPFYYENEVDFRAPIFYEDMDKTSELHVALVNRNGSAKTAGDAGEIKLRFELEPIY